METNEVAEGNWEKLLFVVLQHKKQRNRVTAPEDQPFCLYFPSDERLVPVLSQTHTHLALHSTFTVQVYIKHSSVCCNFSHFFFFPFPFSFHSLSAWRGNENRGRTLGLNCSLFMLSSRVNMEPSNVN